jgi:hypothetical protein
MCADVAPSWPDLEHNLHIRLSSGEKAAIALLPAQDSMVWLTCTTARADVSVPEW